MQNDIALVELDDAQKVSYKVRFIDAYKNQVISLRKWNKITANQI